MTTFGLVHGAWHGAWCWERLVPELEARGHAAIAMDLPVSDGTATFSDYAAAVLDALPDSPDVVLVGHSLGSVVAPLVAARRPVAAVVFLCGVIPKLGGQPWDDAPPMHAPGAFDALVQHPDGSTTWPDVETARRAMYGRCSAEDAAWAFAQLRPQNPSSLWGSPYPLTSWPQTRYAAICCSDDAAVTTEFSRHVCRERLGIEPVEIPGDHSPFLGNPSAVADLLVQLSD